MAYAQKPMTREAFECITDYPIGEPNTGFAQYFVGKSYLAPMDAANGGPINVTFEPGCRNNWHIHHGAVQVLICVAGRGWYQEWGKEPVELKPGVTVAVPEGVKHWHGAACDSWMQHLTYETKVVEGHSNEWLEPVDVEEIQKVFAKMGDRYAAFKDLISKRYSCRKFSGEKIGRAQLKAILEAGRLAPTAKNIQEQHIYVIESEENLSKIDKATPCRYGAQTCLVVAFDKESVYKYPGGKRDSGIEDATIVATHMMLAAKAAGVESCWLNSFDPEKLARLLGLPENEEILMVMDLGYPAEDATPSPNHSSRKPLSETVTYL